MPWKIAPKTKDGKKVFCVVNADTGAEMHCHPTRKQALKQQAALYVNKASEDIEDDEVSSIVEDHLASIVFDEEDNIVLTFDDPETEEESEDDESDDEENENPLDRETPEDEPEDEVPPVRNAEKPPTFLRRMYALLRGKVSEEDFNEAVKSARGHAGGVATADKRKLAFEGYTVDYATPSLASPHYPGDGDCGLPKDDERINYRAATQVGTQCGECMFYREGGRCIIVEGHIDEGGVCDMFSDVEAMGFDESRQFAQQRRADGKFGSGGGSGKSEPHKFGTDVHLKTEGGKTVVHVGGKEAGHVQYEGGSWQAHKLDVGPVRGVGGTNASTRSHSVSTHINKEAALQSVVEHGRRKNAEAVRAISKKSSEVADLAYVTGPHEHGEWAFFVPFQFAEPPRRYQYMPAPGNYISGKYGEIEITRERNERFVRNFNDGIYDQKLPVDLEHELKLSGAAGYIEQLELNEDGSIDAVPSWNRRGETMITEDRFRYFSPEWYDKWVRPEDGKVFYDVAIGGALVTRPFFKEKSLRSLVATEQGLAIIERERDDMSREAPPNPTPISMSEMQEQLRQANEALAASEAKRTEESTKMAERLQTLEDERTEMRFSETVHGRGVDSEGKPYMGPAWLGPVPVHVATMMHIAKTAGEDSDLFKDYVAAQRSNAELLRQNKAFEEIGTSQGLDMTRDASAEDQMVAAAQKLVDEGKAKTLSEAQEQVVLSNPELYRKATERHYK